MESSRDNVIVKIPTSLGSHIICMFAAVALMVIASIYFTPQQENFSKYLNIPSLQEWLFSPWRVVVNISATILLSLLISTLSNKYSFATLFSLYPVLFIMMMQSCNPTLSTTFNIGILAAIVIFLSTYYLFENYGQRRVEKEVFGITLLLCATSILWYKILFFIPLFWIGMLQMNMLSVKSMAASLMAIATVVALVSASRYVGIAEYDFVRDWEHIKAIVTLNDYKTVTPKEFFQVAYMIPMLLLVLIYNLGNLYAESHEKISLKRYLLFINTILFTTIILMALNPLSIMEYAPIFNGASALLAAHYFNSIKSKTKLRFFYLIVFSYITIYIVWIL